MDKKAVEALKCSTYPSCNNIEEHKIDVEIGEDQMKKFSQSYTVLPLVEHQIQDYICLRRVSLRRNELLACRWRERVSNLEVYLRNRKLFKFPRQGDFHFHNYHNRYLPEASTDNSLNHRRTLRPGPGEDEIGQLPIPADHLPITRAPCSWKCKEKHAKRDCKQQRVKKDYTHKKFATKETGKDEKHDDEKLVTIFRRDATCPSSSTSTSVDLLKNRRL